jgi:hypothetical protein
MENFVFQEYFGFECELCVHVMKHVAFYLKLTFYVPVMCLVKYMPQLLVLTLSYGSRYYASLFRRNGLFQSDLLEVKSK